MPQVKKTASRKVSPGVKKAPSGVKKTAAKKKTGSTAAKKKTGSTGTGKKTITIMV